MWVFFLFYIRSSALLCVLIYLFKTHMNRARNLPFWGSYKQAALGMESRCECGLLSLVYTPVALQSPVVAVVAKCIRKTWKYIRGRENEVCPWSSSLGRRNSVCQIHLLGHLQRAAALVGPGWCSVTSALCFPKLWYTGLLSEQCSCLLLSRALLFSPVSEYLSSVCSLGWCWYWKVLLILKIMMINCPFFAIARNRKNEFVFL